MKFFVSDLPFSIPPPPTPNQSQAFNTYLHFSTTNSLSSPPFAKMATSKRRVSWAHDSDSLEKPKPTKIATYIIGDENLICKVEIVPAPCERPAHLRRWRRAKPKIDPMVVAIKAIRMYLHEEIQEHWLNKVCPTLLAIVENPNTVAGNF